jgi:hypothetical protein
MRHLAASSRRMVLLLLDGDRQTTVSTVSFNIPTASAFHAFVVSIGAAGI